MQLRTWLIQLIGFSVLVPSCNSSLRRDDIAGRPCPCLDGWQPKKVDGTCTCVKPGSAAGGASSSVAVVGGGGLQGGTESGGSSSGPDATASGGISVPTPPFSGGSSATSPSAGSGAINLGGAESGTAIQGSGGSTQSVQYGGGGTATAGGSSSAVGTDVTAAGSGNANGCPAVLVPPESTACDSSCNACIQGECQYYCNTVGACAGGQIINCAAGKSCHVICSGSDSCDALVVNCPPQYPCQLECTGKGACLKARLNCSEDGPCSLDCSAGTCRTASIHCGKNACLRSCNPQITASDCAGSCIPDCGCP